MSDLTPERHAEIIGDFLEFSKYMFKEVTGSEFVENWHHKEMCDTLEKCLTGEITRLVINIPPRYSKTRVAVVNFIAWSMGLYPDSEFLHVSYSATLAENNSYDTKMLVEHEAYKDLFPYVNLKKDSNARNKWMTEQGGVVHAMGTDGTITGKGAGKMRTGFAGAMIIDDPIKAQDSHSERMVPKVNDIYTGALESRLNSKKTCVIVIMQRLAENDLAGFLLEGNNGEDWHHLNFPAINEKGEALWPFKHTVDDLKRMDASDPYTFASQYMQVPAPVGGGIFKEDWLNYYDSYTLPELKYTFITADTAQKVKEQNDYSVIQWWGYGVDGNVYLLDMRRGKWEAPELEQQFIQFYIKCSAIRKIRACYIEDKASGTGLIQSLKRRHNVPVKAVQRNTDKITRAYDTAPWLAQGKVYLPSGAEFLPDLKKELCLFPVAKHDDCVDPLMDAVQIAFHKKQGSGAVSFG